MAKETQTYNGYTNYETWAVSLWLDNEEYSQDWLYDLANDETKAPHAKEDEVKDEVTEMAPDLGASMYSDLLTAALANVNWREIIKTHMEVA